MGIILSERGIFMKTISKSHGKIIPIGCSPKLRPDIRVTEIAADWLDHIRPTLKQSTLSIYSGILRAHIEPAFGSLPVSALTTEQIEAFLAEKATVLAAGTVSNISTVLRALLTHALHTGKIMQLPAWLCPTGKSNHTGEVLDTRE